MRLYYKKALAAAAVTAMLSVSAFAAPVYRDVPSDHWGYQSISAVADLGLMVGDTSANFRPNEMIDKFETSKILARSAGYKYENVSAAELDYYNRCYEKNKSFLSQYSSRFSKWNTTADKEIAFLLEKEILTAADLNQFVIINGDKEQLRALSRGEAAVFITRLIGENAEALEDTSPHDFNDDASIAEAIRPYVYHLKSKGILTGDTDGNFNPNSAVTRAAMAVMLARALDLISVPQSTPNPSPTPTPEVGVSQVVTISGTVDGFYDRLNAVQIISGTGERAIYTLSENASVYIDGYQKTGADLKEGMIFSAVVNNNMITNIQAVSETEIPEIEEPPVELQYTYFDGTVYATDIGEAADIISIEVKTLNPRDGSIVSDVKDYTLAADCEITRGGEEILFSEITPGDIVSAKISGDKAYALEVEEKILKLRDATLEDKRYDRATDTVTFIVSDGNDKHYEIRVAPESTMIRAGLGSASWNEILVGDRLSTLTAEYGVLTELRASGSTSSTDGWINDVVIGTHLSYINLRDSNGEISKYYVITESTDIYSLRVGSRVRLRLDSREVYTVILLEAANTSTVTGYVSSVRSSKLVLSNTQPYGTNGKRDIVIDADTVFVDSTTGDKVNFNTVRTGQKVYVVCEDAFSDVAKTVTILSE